MKTRKKNLRMFFSVCLVVVVLIGIAMAQIMSEKSFDVMNADKNYLSAEDLEVGQNSIISSVQIVQTDTGTGPFDEDDLAGNDSSKTNSIVRTFDQVIWTVENTMELKEGALAINYSGGVINVTATLSENVEDTVTWDLESMLWMENASISNDGRTVSGQYAMTEDGVTVPGKQNLVFVAKVLGAKNGLQITPTFELSIAGNETSEVKTLTAPAVSVSAAPNYNIKLTKSEHIDTLGYYDTATGEKVEEANSNTAYGRMQGYGVTLQLYNTSVSKGLKGIEIPSGTITMDIDFDEGTTNSPDSSLVSDPEYVPLLWDYKPHQHSNRGKLNRNMLFNGIDNSKYAFVCAPFNDASLVPLKQRSVYYGGDYTITKVSDTKYRIEVSDYEFDINNMQFPTHTYGQIISMDPEYTANVGCFSAGYIEVLCRFPTSVSEITNIYMTASISNPVIKSLTNQSGRDLDSSDNSNTSSITLYPAGTISKIFYIKDENNESVLENVYYEGKSRAALGQKITAHMELKRNYDYPVKAWNYLFKFDSNALELDETRIQTTAKNSMSVMGTTTYLYAAKRDKTGWVNTAEMNSTREGDLIYFEDLSELKAQGYTPVGLLTEERNATLYTGNQKILCFSDIGLKVKSYADINKTYAIMGDFSVWDNGTTFTRRGNPTTSETPSAVHNTTNYIKIEYDENGEMIPGTHSNGWKYGQSLLVVGADLSVTQSLTQKIEDSEKINYDIDKKETTVGYSINPVLRNPTLAEGAISGVTIKIEDTLPQGLTYIPESGNYPDPTITSNLDGSTKLTWIINNCSVNKTIEPITFNTHINELLDNGTQLESTVVISEVVPNGSNPKIGNASIDQRTVKKDINVINLASYSLYKETETPIIELNGVVHYKITAINKTESDLSEFQLLDILPYNGDGRGSNFSGNYTVQKIELNATNLATNTSQSITGYNLVTTNSTSVRSGVTAKDTDLGTSEIWTSATSGQTLDTALTGYAVIGTLPQKSKLEIDVYLKTEGNDANDLYENSATAQTSHDTEVMQTPIIGVRDINRQLEGYVWFDSNKDGLKQDDEPYLENYKLTLLNEDGSAALDTAGNTIADARTNSSGYYMFKNMVRGNYKVLIEITNDEYEITKKNVGTDNSINSCFGTNKESPVITELNRADEPDIVRNVNAGVAYQDTTVLVHHYKKGTTTKLSPDVTLEGKIGDYFVTEPGEEVPTEYEVDNIAPMETGYMTKDPIVIVYEYALKKYPYKVNYYEVNLEGAVIRELATQKTGPDTTLGETITGLSEKIDIPGYYYKGSSGNITISNNVDQNVISLYYVAKEDQPLTVYYQEKDTEVEIHMPKHEDDRALGEVVHASDEVLDLYGWNYNSSDKEQVVLGPNEEENVITIYYTKKPAELIVHHYIDGTTTKIVDDESRDGKVFDYYQTNPLYDLNNEYRLMSTPLNQNGYLKEEPTHVIYYYRLLKGLVTIKYLRQGDGEPLAPEDTQTGEIYSVYNTSPITIPGYEYVTSVGNTSGVFSDLPEVVEYYYVKKGKVTVNHIDKLKYDAAIAANPDAYADGSIPEDSLLCDPVIKEEKIGYVYNATPMNFEGYELTSRPDSETVTIAEDEIVLNYFYNYRSGGVIEKHVDIINGTVLNNEYQEGQEGDHYNTNEENKSFGGYLRVTNKQYLDTFGITDENYTEKGLTEERYELLSSNPDESYVPSNKEGIMTKDLTEVIYYYIRPARIKVEYIDKNTGEPIPNTDGTSSEEREGGFEGETYETHSKEFTGYELAKNKDVYTETELEEKGLDPEEKYVPENHKGTKNVDDDGNNEEVIVYYYLRTSAGITEKHIDIKTEDLIVEERHQSGREGDWYATNFVEKDTYRPVTNAEYYQFIGEEIPDGVEPDRSYEPTNAKGQMTVEEQVVRYYYIKQSTVRVEYRDSYTGEEIPGTLEEYWMEDESTNPNEREENTSREYIYGREGDPYMTREKHFENYTIDMDRYPTNTSGKMIMVENTDGTYTTEIVVTYWYKEYSGGVTVKHEDFETGEVLATYEYIGTVGDEYETEAEDIEEYEQIDNQNYYSPDEMRIKRLIPDDKYVPENYKGTLKKEHEDVVYYYLKKTKVTAIYIDVETGDRIADDEEYYGKVGDQYSTERKVVPDYELDEIPYNADGTMKRNEMTVIYHYKKIDPNTPDNPDNPDTPDGPDNPDSPNNPNNPNEPGPIPGSQSMQTIINNYYYTTNNHYVNTATTATVDSGTSAQTKTDTSSSSGTTGSTSGNKLTITDASNNTNSNNANNANNTNNTNSANGVTSNTPSTGDSLPVIAIAVMIITVLANLISIIVKKNKVDEEDEKK